MGRLGETTVTTLTASGHWLLCVFPAHPHQKRRLASGKRGNALLEMVSTSRHTDNEIPSAKDTGPPLESSIETHTEPPNRS